MHLWNLSVPTVRREVETAEALEVSGTAAMSQAAAKRDPASNKDDTKVVLYLPHPCHSMTVLALI